MENKEIIELQDEELNEVNGGKILITDALYVETNKYSQLVPEEERLPVNSMLYKDRLSKEFKRTHPFLGRAASWPVIGMFIGYVVGDMKNN